MEAPAHYFLDHNSRFTVLIATYEALGSSVLIERISKLMVGTI